MYPLVIRNLERWHVVVVGGGPVAERKVAGLLEGGARPLVVSPALTPQLEAWRALGAIGHEARRSRPEDVAGADLVILATNDHAANAALAAACQGRQLVNVADAPASGTFNTVATVRRGELLLTASTSGASPSLTAFVRRRLERLFDTRFARLATLAREQRQELSALGPPERARWFDAMLDAIPHEEAR